MNAIILTIILTTPTGGYSETRQQFDDRAACRTEKALAHATMRTDAKGYVLVSADCDPVQQKRGAK